MAKNNWRQGIPGMKLGFEKEPLEKGNSYKPHFSKHDENFMKRSPSEAFIVKSVPKICIKFTGERPC